MLGEPWLAASAARAFPLFSPTRCAELAVGAEAPCVLRAVGDMARDWERVAPIAPTRVATPRAGVPTLLAATPRNPLIQQWVGEGRLDLRGLEGTWEACLVATVGEVLCVVGSDDRGLIFGLYRLSEALGVSPWHWWSRTPVKRRSEAWLNPGPRLYPGPRVRYRGLFLNDEDPNLTRWVRERWGECLPGVARYGREFYALFFELLLRLGGNTVWPAMWNNAFYEDDENGALAREFGVVMGTSHQEPMTRAQKEWDRRYHATLGSWDWSRHRDTLVEFWRQAIRERRNDEVLVTVGLRGADDTEMSQGTPEECRAMLEQIIAVQRGLLAEETGRPAAQVPQVWCLYKEVLDYYRRGLRVPDDVTLLWPDDNWGHLRRLPTAEERKRPGGAGIYYHFDYHGGPRSYQWVHSTPLGKVWHHMSLAAQYGADRFWIVNVGHLKGYELATEFFLRLGWNPEAVDPEGIEAWTVAWATREFGPLAGPLAARLLGDYGRLNGRRKPELLAPETFSLVHDHEAERVCAEYRTLAEQARTTAALISADAREAYYQVVEFPITACRVVCELYIAAGRHRLYRQQGRASAAFWADEARRLFADDQALMAHYNHDFAHGAWNHFMDQPHLGYTSWKPPVSNNLDALELEEVSVPEGVRPGCFAEGGGNLLTFDGEGSPRHWIDVFRRGTAPFPYQVTCSHSFVVVSSYHGWVTDDVRLWLTLDEGSVPRGTQSATVSITAGGEEFRFEVRSHRWPLPRGETARVRERDELVVIEASRWHRCSKKDGHWERLTECGPWGTGARAWAPLDAQFAPGEGPVLEYDLWTHSLGPAFLHLVLEPSLNCWEGRPVRWAWSWEDGPVTVVEAVPADFEAMHHNLDWEKTVADSVRHSRVPITLDRRGPRTLKLWMIDPGLVVYRLYVDAGGLKPSYLGPASS